MVKKKLYLPDDFVETPFLVSRVLFPQIYCARCSTLGVLSLSVSSTLDDQVPFDLAGPQCHQVAVGSGHSL